MFAIRNMMETDEKVVMDFVRDFYSGSAVDHSVPDETLVSTFHDAVSDKVPVLRGIILEEDGEPIGYGYILQSYATETGGECIVIEELYVSEAHRGNRYGTACFEWIFEQYPQARRFRLEVTKSNIKAIKLYKKLGFEFLNYGQMIKDR